MNNLKNAEKSKGGDALLRYPNRAPQSGALSEGAIRQGFCRRF